MKIGVVVAMVGLSAFVGAVSATHAAQRSRPKFVDYPVAVSVSTKRPPLQLNSGAWLWKLKPTTPCCDDIVYQQ